VSLDGMSQMFLERMTCEHGFLTMQWATIIIFLVGAAYGMFLRHAFSIVQAAARETREMWRSAR
jgi:hypothetical protein